MMKINFIEVEGIMVDERLLTVKFACDYDVCKGACCWAEIDYDTGGLLLLKEHQNLIATKESLRPFVPTAYRKTFNKAVTMQQDGEYFTNTCGAACIYSDAKNKTCALKLAHKAKVTNFAIPMHCETYPADISIRKDKTYVTVLDVWDEHCAPAYIKGERDNMPLFRFLRKPLIQYIGAYFYNGLEEAYSRINEDSTT